MKREVSGAVAKFEYDKSRVGNLVRWQALPTIGEIAWAVASDIKWVPYRMPTDEYLRWHSSEYYPFLWELLDQQFGNRPDYRLWRIVARPLFLSVQAKQWPPLPDIVQDALGSQESQIVWGAMAVLSGLLTSKSKRGAFFPTEELRGLVATQCERRILASLAPLAGAEVGCALVEVLTWSAIQQVQHESGRRFTLAETASLFDRLEASIGKADPNWRPGQILRIGDLLEREQASGRVLAPYNPVELQVRIAEALFKMRAAASGVRQMQLLDGTGDEVLRRAALLALSSWRFTRSVRIGEEKFQRDNPTYDAAYEITSLREAEMVALKTFGQSLGDAGNYLDASFVAWLLLTTTPNVLLDKREFRRIGTQLSGSIRSAGLKVPARFARPKEENTPYWERELRASSNGHDGTEESTGVASDKATTARRANLRLNRELRRDYRWVAIQGVNDYLPCDPFAALGRIVNRRGELAENTGVLRAAFGLCLKYGRLREASQVAECLQLSRQELLDFTHSVKRASQLNLLAVDQQRHAQWHKVLRQNWSKLSTPASLDGDDLLALHEVLVGRYPSILRHAGSAASPTLALKLYDRLADEDIEEFVQDLNFALRRGPATVTIGNLQKSLQQSDFGSIGLPVCLSLARLDDDCVSIAAIGSRGAKVDQIELPEIGSAVRAVQSTYALWTTGGANLACRIPWHSSLWKLAEKIVDLTRMLDPSCKWLVLALESDLSSLPWNNLIRQVQDSNFLVSLVPSLSWFNREIRDRAHSSSTVERHTLQLSSEADLENIASHIKKDEHLLGQIWESFAVVLGHGRITEEGVPEVRIGSNVVTLDEWLKLADHRVLVVHSCHGGRVSQSFPGDLGGLPGVALSIGCRLFLAPVAEVSPDVAMSLHDEIVREDGAIEIGLRYDAAIRRDPSVSLYNMYGIPSESVLTTFNNDRRVGSSN